MTEHSKSVIGYLNRLYAEENRRHTCTAERSKEIDAWRAEGAPCSDG